MSFDLKSRLAEIGIQPKKALGQNFLISASVIHKITQAVVTEKFESLIEVGPGVGALTEPLCTAGHSPHLIELDDQLIEYWTRRGLKVTAGDALQLDWAALDLKTPALLVSNLPYQISTSLVIDRCFEPVAITKMVLMFQKEVAQRLTASPSTKEYGFLSVVTQLHFKMRKVTDAAPGDFFPAPKVASRVLRFERILQPTLGFKFLKFVKQAFAFRRKFLVKNLKSILTPAQLEQLPGWLEELDLSAKVRAEELTPPQFVSLFERIYEY